MEIAQVAGADERPGGTRFGALVHALLADVPLSDAGPDVLERLASAHGRVLGAEPSEVAAAQQVVQEVLAHPLLRAAAEAAVAGRCYRETPVTWRLDDGALVEGNVDLAYERDGGMVVIDFKTDREVRGAIEHVSAAGADLRLGDRGSHRPPRARGADEDLSRQSAVSSRLTGPMASASTAALPAAAAVLIDGPPAVVSRRKLVARVTEVAVVILRDQCRAQAGGTDVAAMQDERLLAALWASMGFGRERVPFGNEATNGEFHDYGSGDVCIFLRHHSSSLI